MAIDPIPESDPRRGEQLAPCPSCGKHCRASDLNCPFCGAAIRGAERPGEIRPVAPVAPVAPITPITPMETRVSPPRHMPEPVVYGGPAIRRDSGIMAPIHEPPPVVYGGPGIRQQRRVSLVLVAAVIVAFGLAAYVALRLLGVLK